MLAEDSEWKNSTTGKPKSANSETYPSAGSMSFIKTRLCLGEEIFPKYYSLQKCFSFCAYCFFFYFPICKSSFTIQSTLIMQKNCIIFSRMHATLHPTLSVGLSVGRSVGRSHFTFFINFIYVSHF